MKTNSYGWIILYMILVVFVGWIGSKVGYTIDGLPAEQTSIAHFLGSLTVPGRIDDMPVVFSVIWDFFYIFPIWIAWRQLAISGGDS